MNPTLDAQINTAWICERLAGFYAQPVQADELLAVRRVQQDVIVIGPDGRKFRLSGCPEKHVTKRKEK
jgi:hypothetical protein